jgi:hypothetical protein
MRAGSHRCHTSLHQGGGIIDRDGSGSLSPSAAALLPRGFVRDVSTEEGTTIARMDHDVKTDARSYVTWRKRPAIDMFSWDRAMGGLSSSKRGSSLMARSTAASIVLRSS